MSTRIFPDRRYAGPVRLLSHVTALGLLCTLAATSLPAQTEVDLALVLAVDASSSVDGGVLAMQRRGHIDAITNPIVLAAISHGHHGRIALAYVEWSSRDRQRLVVPLTAIADAEDAAAFARQIKTGRMGDFQGLTAIGTALGYAGTVLRDARLRTDRRVIDISSNGIWNNGARPSVIRDALVEAGVTINGLPIVGGFDSTYFGNDYDHILEQHFLDCVIGGADAFVLPVLDQADFTKTLIYKMVYEIAGLSPPPRPMVFRAAQADC
jgi:hypothetical protein